jgi:hypothetical protein
LRGTVAEACRNSRRHASRRSMHRWVCNKHPFDAIFESNPRGQGRRKRMTRVQHPVIRWRGAMRGPCCPGRNPCPWVTTAPSASCQHAKRGAGVDGHLMLMHQSDHTRRRPASPARPRQTEQPRAKVTPQMMNLDLESLQCTTLSSEAIHHAAQHAQQSTWPCGRAVPTCHDRKRGSVPTFDKAGSPGANARLAPFSVLLGKWGSR